MFWRNSHSEHERKKLELNNSNFEKDFPKNVPPELRWSFYCRFQSHNSNAKYPTATWLWVVAEDRESAIMEAEKQVKLITGGWLGYILRGFIDGSGKKPEKYFYAA